MIEIREASLNDINELMEWRLDVLREVFSIPHDQDLSDIEAANRSYYVESLANGEHVACFASSGHETIGCGGICFQNELPSPENKNGKCGYLMNIYVRKEFRQRGTGKKIIEWLINEAGIRGVSKIILDSTERGRALYEELGFRPAEGYMILTEKD